MPDPDPLWQLATLVVFAAAVLVIVLTALVFALDCVEERRHDLDRPAALSTPARPCLDVGDRRATGRGVSRVRDLPAPDARLDTRGR